MKTILFTGGTGLVATPQVRHFLTKGDRVVITYRHEEKLAALGAGDLVAIKVPDLLAPGAVDGLVAELRSRGIAPDCLVNNAVDGRWHWPDADGHVSEENFINHYRLNVYVPYDLSWKLVHEPGSKLRRIVNISSMYGVIPYDPNLYEHPETETSIHYATAKAALIHLTKELAIRFKDRGVSVNAVSYGGVDGRASDDFRRKFERVTPLKRMMKPEETVPAVEFLLEEASGYMTGQNLIVDGGRTVW